jgi:NAD(P)-dependent dehydrogenase (short-subunit alcohol dehydrogenase family)
MPNKRKDTGLSDPRQIGPKPPHPAQRQSPPGNEKELRPRADHGEDSYRGSGKLEGKVALITGADSGIGKAVALAFAREGADIVISYLNEHDVISYLNEHDDAQDTLRLVTDSDRKAILVAGDIGDEAHCNGLVERAVKDFGRLDILVNNAAFQRVHDELEEFSADEWRQTFRTNIDSMFYLSKAAARHMRPGSAIVNTASIQAYHPSPNLLAYATTKAAIVNFTKALAGLLGKRGIRVNAVAPGPIWTPLIPSTMKPDKVEHFSEDTPLGRAGQPAEATPAFVLLASDDGSYISGSVISVTGGRPTM